jgi:hypothetical protein
MLTRNPVLVLWVAERRILGGEDIGLGAVIVTDLGAGAGNGMGAGPAAG